MSSFPVYFSQAWHAVFRDKKSFLILFLLMGGMSLLSSSAFYAYGINIFDPNDVTVIFYSRKLVTILFGFSLLSFFVSFFGMLALVKTFRNKKIKLSSVLVDWKKIFPYLGTLLCSFLYCLLILLFVLIGAGVIFGIGFIIYWALPYILEWPHTVRLVLAIAVLAIGFLICLTIGIFVVRFVVSLYTFILPAFFLDNHKYFSAAAVSRKLVYGRWWKTFGNIVLLILIFVIIMIGIALARFYLVVYTYPSSYLFAF